MTEDELKELYRELICSTPEGENLRRAFLEQCGWEEAPEDVQMRYDLARAAMHTLVEKTKTERGDRT